MVFIPETAQEKVENCKCLWVSPGLNKPCNLNFKPGNKLSKHMLQLHLYNLSKPFVCCWQTCIQNFQNRTTFEDEKSLLEHVKIHWTVQSK